MKKIIIFLFVLLMIQPTLVVNAEHDLQDPIFNLASIRYASLSLSLVERWDATAKKTITAINLQEKQTLWEKTYDDIYDVKVLNTPLKIVLIARETNDIKKIVLSSTGVIISEKTYIDIKPPTRDGVPNRIKWFPGKKGVPEQLAVLDRALDQNVLKVYNYPWKTPFIQKKINIVDRGYEYTTVAEWEYNYPTLLIKYGGGGMMRTDYFMKIYNLSSTQKEITFKLDQNYDMHLTPATAVMTSKNYVVGLGFCPDACYEPNTAVTLLENIDLATGKIKVIEKQTISEAVNLNAWFADKIGNYIYTEDLVNHTWHIYSQKGEQLKTGVHDSSEGRFIYYNSRNQNVFYLSLDSEGKYVVSQT